MAEGYGGRHLVCFIGQHLSNNCNFQSRRDRRMASSFVCEGLKAEAIDCPVIRLGIFLPEFRLPVPIVWGAAANAPDELFLPQTLANAA